MPKLTPLDIDLTNKLLDCSTDAEVQQLKSAPLDTKLRKHNLTTDDCLEQLSSIMHYGKNPNHKIAVAKMGLEMNGVLVGDKAEKIPQAIQFVFNDSTVNLAGVLNPVRNEIK